MKKFYSNFIKTPIGQMIAIADEASLYLLEFEDRIHLEDNINKVKQKFGVLAKISESKTPPLVSIENELLAYFNGTLQTFQTPVHMRGTPFQISVWQSLQKIPYGHTISYREQTISLGRDKGFRATARGNATNNLAIIIPCHRVVRSNGAVGGYAGGINKKEWLLAHEQTFITKN